VSRLRIFEENNPTQPIWTSDNHAAIAEQLGAAGVRFQQWQANLRVLEISEIKTSPYVPLSHPFLERLIGTGRRDYLDRILFWSTADLEES